MGGLFCEHQPINIINNMKYHEMKYWHAWHEAMQKEYKKVGE